MCLLGVTTVLGDGLGVKAEKRKLATVSIQATGTLMPEDVVDVAAQVPGQVQALGADPDQRDRTVDCGTRVKVGTVLAQLDPTLYQARVDRARAQLRKARAALKSAKMQTEAGNARKADLDMAEAKEELARAGLKEAEARPAYTTIRCPIEGVIIDRRVQIGQNVGVDPKLPSLFLIGKVDRLQLWGVVGEADVGKVQGTVAPGQPRLNAAMTANKVTYTVVINVDNSDRKLLPYLTAHLQIVVPE